MPTPFKTLVLLVFTLTTLLSAAQAQDKPYPVPPPKPVATQTQVGAFIFPGWYRNTDTADDPHSKEDKTSEWRAIAAQAGPRPLLGFYDDSLPEVNDWHIKWALEAGISFFAFDWYTNVAPDGTLEHRLARTLDRGFLGARYNEQMKFCIHWCNHGLDWRGGLDFGPKQLETVITDCAERYFQRPNYLKVGNRPVFMVWDAQALFDDNGGAEAFGRDTLPRLNAITRAHGLGDLFLVWVDNDPRRAANLPVGDAATGYSYAYLTTVTNFNQPGAAPYSEMVDKLPAFWQQVQRGRLPFIPSTQAGWDNTPRALNPAGPSPETRWVRTENTPEQFERSLREGQALVTKDLPFFIIEAWNEWGEGSTIEPNAQYGYKQLDAVRRVFAPEAGANDWTTPSPEQVAAYSVLKGQELAAAQKRATQPATPPPPIRPPAFTVALDPAPAAGPALPILEEVRFGDPAVKSRLEPNGTMRPVGVSDGQARFQITGDDPHLLLSGDWGEASQVAAVTLRVTFDPSSAAYPASQAELFWVTDRAPLNQGNSQRYEWLADGKAHTYQLTFRPETPREGRLTGVRLDLPDCTGATVTLDRLQVLGQPEKAK